MLRNFLWLPSPCSPCAGECPHGWTKNSSRYDFSNKDYKKPRDPSTHTDVKYHLAFTTGASVADDCLSEANAIRIYNEHWVGKKQEILTMIHASN